MRKLVGSLVVAILTTLLVAALRSTPPTGYAFVRIDDVLYDTMYGLRPAAIVSDASVAVLAVDQDDVREMNKYKNADFPWPREFWGIIARYLERCGAKAIVFDLQFSGA